MWRFEMFLNSVKTTLLLVGLTVLIMLFGRIFGGQGGMAIAFVFALIFNIGSYWFSDKIVLKMYRANEARESEFPGLYSIVNELSIYAKIPRPKIYIIPTESPNAFATGRNPAHGVVAVTEGIMRLLTHDELKGVLAHEIGHIKNRDILISTISATLAAVIMMMANMARWGAIFGFGSRDEDSGGGLIGLIAASIFAPIAAMLIQMAISRSREYMADEAGARISHTPLALASALEKISNASQRVPISHGNPATSHMFIINPFNAGTIAKLFSTHPPVEERIRRLRNLG